MPKKGKSELIECNVSIVTKWTCVVDVAFKWIKQNV